MSKPEKEALTKETLKSRAQICRYEQDIKSVEVDSRILSRLVGLGTAPGANCFAKLFGYFNANLGQVVIKDCIVLPSLDEDNPNKLSVLENEEKSIRTNLGFQFQCVGTFVRSRGEDAFDESVCFYLTHFNVYEGFGLLLVYSAETARTSQACPIQAFVPSEALSSAYKFKLDKELFEPDPVEVASMLRQKKAFLRQVSVRPIMSPVLDLILKRHQHELRAQNAFSLDTQSRNESTKHLESGLTQTVHHVANVLTSQRSLEMRRQHLLNLMGALRRTETLLKLDQAKLKKDEAKLSQLGGLANPVDKLN